MFWECSAPTRGRVSQARGLPTRSAGSYIPGATSHQTSPRASKLANSPSITSSHCPRAVARMLPTCKCCACAATSRRAERIAAEMVIAMVTMSPIGSLSAMPAYRTSTTTGRASDSSSPADLTRPARAVFDFFSRPVHKARRDGLSPRPDHLSPVTLPPGSPACSVSLAANDSSVARR